MSVVIFIFVTVELIEFVQRTTLNSVIGLVEESLATGVPQTNILTEATLQIESVMLYVFAIIIATSIVTGIVASNLALRPVRDALALQRRFIASIAHELRTPLAILKTQNEVAKLEVAPDAPIANVLQENIHEIDHITQMFNSLLLFNRIDTLESIPFEHVDLSNVLTTVCGRLQRFAERKGVRLHCSDKALPTVYGNVTALEQAFFNVTKNALNYTKSGGVVRIECNDVTDRDVTIVVADTGIGIAKKDMPHIFEPFYRTTTGQEQGRGAGLGLALVFEIMKLHGGKIRIESEVGSGTQVYLTMPRKQSAVAEHGPNKGERANFDFSGKRK